MELNTGAARSGVLLRHASRHDLFEESVCLGSNQAEEGAYSLWKLCKQQSCGAAVVHGLDVSCLTQRPVLSVTNEK